MTAARPALSRRLRLMGAAITLGAASLLSAAPAFARGPDGIADVAEKVIDAVVNISTSQTVDASKGASELTEAELAGYFMESDGPFGHLRHLKPVTQLSETPAYFVKPAEPLGTSPARWA